MFRAVRLFRSFDSNTCTTVWYNNVDIVLNAMAHGDAWEGKLRGNRRMEWVPVPRNTVYPALLPAARWFALLDCQYSAELTPPPI
jgi:hypothetical protein